LIAEVDAKIERQRLLNAVRSLYYQALGDQYRIHVRTNLAKLAQEAVRISHELVNVGEADQPDQLAAEVEAQRIQLELAEAVEHQQSTWRQLGAMLNEPSLPPSPLAGDLEALPRLEMEQALEEVFEGNPELQAAMIEVNRSELAFKRAQKEVIPDLIVSGGVRHNNELLEPAAGGNAGRRSVGPEGFFDIGVEVPLFNRNQGNIAAERASLESAKLDVERAKLALRARLADAYREYKTALTRAERYKQDILPKAQKAYELYLASFHQMAAAYPQALIAQRSLFQLQDEYAATLVAAWQWSTEIQGQLASGGNRK
jgi:cobalt-zinc-cadmium efflux system outer membrane protein